MAKFSVGEVCLDVPGVDTDPDFLARYGSIIQVTILSVPGMARKATERGWNGAGWISAGIYEALLPDGCSVGVPEECLRKLPPDDHIEIPAEERGLILIKKLLRQDMLTRKQPIKTTETES